jgi:hypothetical protein
MVCPRPLGLLPPPPGANPSNHDLRACLKRNTGSFVLTVESRALWIKLLRRILGEFCFSKVVEGWAWL